MTNTTINITAQEDVPPGASTTPEKFVTIITDPPWGNQGQKGRYGAVSHYDLMSIDAIRDMPVGDLAADNAHLYLWCYPAVRRLAEEIMEHWVFRFVDEFVWGKDQMGLGQYFRHAHETLLLGVKGKLPVSFRGQRSFAMLPRQAHSHKPEEVHQIMSTAKRGRGRPRRDYRIRVRAERREVPDYDKLARALLEHAAMEQAKKTPPAPERTVDTEPSVIDEIAPPSTDNTKKNDTNGGGQ